MDGVVCRINEWLFFLFFAVGTCLCCISLVADRATWCYDNSIVPGVLKVSRWTCRICYNKGAKHVSVLHIATTILDMLEKIVPSWIHTL